MVMTKILILDDCVDRMVWLQREYPEYQVLFATTIVGFSYLLDQYPYPGLVILDHDLGTVETGADAVELVDITTPVLVWSNNIPAALRMGTTLQERGNPVVVRPYTAREGLGPDISMLVEAGRQL